MSQNWKFRLGILATAAITAAAVWAAIMMLPIEMFLLGGSVVVIVVGFALDAHISRNRKQ